MSKKRIKTGKMDNLGRVRLGSIRNKNDWNNASKRLFGSFSHSGIPGFLFRLFYSQEQNSRNIFWNIFRNKFLFRNIPNERALGVVTLLYSLLVQKTEIYGRTVFFSEFTFFRLDSQIFFTLSTVLILHLYYTYNYSFNILANYTTYTYTTDTYTTLQYDTKLKKSNLKKYETTYNTITMLLRTILTVQYNYKLIKLIIYCVKVFLI